MTRKQGHASTQRELDRSWYSDPIGHEGPPHLRLAEETLRVRDYEVAVCRISEYDLEEGTRASFQLVAMTGDHWYQVGVDGTLERAREVAERLERPCDRTHRLSLTRATRTAALTPEIYALTGQTTVTGEFMRVWWAPPGSGFRKGAEYGSPLDARHPRWVTKEDLAADHRRHCDLYPFWRDSVADAWDLAHEVFGPFEVNDEPMSRASSR